jgi:predicted nucleotidyltransferase
MIMENIHLKIDKMVRRIVSEFHPLKIILFGSHASGTANLDSDVDLIIVMDPKGSKRKQAAKIDASLADRDIPLDLIVVTPHEFEQYHDIAGHILYPAVRQGRILYEHSA